MGIYFNPDCRWFYVSLTRIFGGIEAPLTPEEAKEEIEQMLSFGIFIVFPVTELALRRSPSFLLRKV
ncbi:MAG: hypothetical protein LWW95_11310 [Candidatus Desulfofervidus auxilii]|nr:hypothetical protein [Candidatus Desulfofervidus auxilii]